MLRDPQIGDYEVELAIDEPEHALRRRIASFFAGRQRDDLLVLHFSCHGLKDDSGQLYFAASDTEVAHLDATALSAEFVSRQITRSRSRKVVALLDCCYSGAFARGLQFRAGETVQLSDHLGGHGRVILTASSAMEYAFEGEELTGAGRPSVFTSAVVKGLETGEADRDGDHRISVEELYDYVCDEVREITPDQSPNMLSHLEGELYFAYSSYVAPHKSSELPQELWGAVNSVLGGVREGAVIELLRLASGPDEETAAAARAALEKLTRDDSPRVAAAAANALGHAEHPELAIAPHPASVPPGAKRRRGGARPRPTPQAETPPAVAPQAEAVASVGSWLPHSGAGSARAHVRVRLLAAGGALTVVASLTVLATSPWPHPIEPTTIVASIAAVLAVAVIDRTASGRRVLLDVLALTLAAAPLGVALALVDITAFTGARLISPVATAIGAFGLGGAALWNFRGAAPAGTSSSTPGADRDRASAPSHAARTLRAMRWLLQHRRVLLVANRAANLLMLLAAATLAIGSILYWEQGIPPDRRETEPPATLFLVGLWTVVAVAAAAATVALLPRRAENIERWLAVAAPGSGMLALFASLTLADWLGPGHILDGVAVMIYAAVFMTAAAIASFILQLLPVTRQ